MEWIVFLIGLFVFAAYGRASIFFLAVGAMVLTASFLPRVAAIDAWGANEWIYGAYLVCVCILLWIGITRGWQRVWAGARANTERRAAKKAK